MKLTVGDMFAGVGGMALAFEEGGFDVIWANEIDPSACKTYKTNFNHILYDCDISKIDTNILAKVDVIVSGFPCQPFSLAGNRQGFNDPRGNMFFETARVIKDLQPMSFLLENVKNLKTHDKGNTLNIIKNTIEKDLGYSFTSFVLSAYKHGNIPQARERIYIVGFRKDIIDKIKKDNKFFLIPEEIPLTTKIGNLLEKSQVSSKYYFKEDHKYMPLLKETMLSTDTIYQWRRVYVRENKNKLCPTLTANMGTGGHNVPLLVDDYGFRRLTPRECFRFQGFPESFLLPKEVADSSLYKQAGNSVTVPVVKRIAECIKQLLEKGTIL